METSYKIIAEQHPSQQTVTLLLNGKFSEESLAELDDSISRARGVSERVLIDLSEVTLVDRKVVQYFSDRASEDIRLVNCPTYLRGWIKQVSEEGDN